jgi:steroid delta-isomerase-like uncharacterized protein
VKRPDLERLVWRWLNEALRDGNVEVFDELLAPEVRDLSSGAVAFGSESFKRRARAVFEAFSNLDAALDELLVDGDRVAWRWSLTGTHRGDFAGVAATGRRVSLRGVNFQRLEGGRVVEHWTLADLAGLQAALRAPAE